MTSFFVVDVSRNVVSTNICAISVVAVCANTGHEAFFATTTFLQGTTSLSSFESGLASWSGPTSEPEPSTLAIFALGIIGLASRRFKKQS
ncbi:PEP-CTERM sorting domain-containing protein [uncultured Paraglaciecola sp.]|uniref:PEP-CTERM sorting domain-containing protein n=1 Tax=uncultured Paraglaciecola sp. TaxID=1765024 RepID=UPI0026340349|nr:PEP-CTERM sorting domain-containing protein [uncultured Paraglaciecola sp.]